MKAAELLDLEPDLIVVVSTDALNDIGVFTEVAIVYSTMIS